MKTWKGALAWAIGVSLVGGTILGYIAATVLRDDTGNLEPWDSNPALQVLLLPVILVTSFLGTAAVIALGVQLGTYHQRRHLQEVERLLAAVLARQRP